MFAQKRGIMCVYLESLAMATQLLAKIPYGVLSGISILKVSRSPMRTVSTSCPRWSTIDMRGAGASGAEVMLEQNHFQCGHSIGFFSREILEELT
jgi:hypothetical protein